MWYVLLVLMLVHEVTATTVSLNNRSPKLTYVPQGITTSVEILNLNNNLITVFSNLTGLTSLQRLYLNYNELTVFPDLSAVGSSLTYLYMNYNRIASIPYDLLNALTVLVRIELRGSSLSALPDAPGPGNSLTNINIYENQFTEIPVLPHLFHSLRFLGLYRNQVVQTPTESFADYSDIRDLHLTENQLTQFPNLTHVKSTITHVRLASNDISYVPYELVNMLTRLYYIILTDNPITEFLDLSAPTNFRYLYLERTGLTEYPDLTHMGARLYDINFGSLNIGPLPADYLAHCPVLRKYIHNHNPSAGVFPDMSVVAGTLRELHIYNNGFTQVPYDSFNILSRLQVVNLGANQLTSIPDCPGPSATLHTLHLHYNRFTSVPSLSSLGTSITFLNLEGNDIAHVDTDVFVNYPIIERLRISNNHLTQLFDLRPLQATLTEVDLRHNQLTYIPEQYVTLMEQQNTIKLLFDNNQLQQVPDFSQLARMTVTFSENPLVCNGSLGWAGHRSDVYCYLPNDDTPHSVRQLNRRLLRLPGVRSPLLGRMRTGWETLLADDDKTSCVDIEAAGHRRLTPCSGFPSSLVTVLSDENLAEGQYIVVNVTHDGNCLPGGIDVYTDESNTCRSYGSTSRMSSSTSRVVHLCNLILEESEGNLRTCSYRCQSQSNVIIAVSDSGSVSSLCDVSYSVVQ